MCNVRKLIVLMCRLNIFQNHKFNTCLLTSNNNNRPKITVSFFLYLQMVTLIMNPMRYAGLLAIHAVVCLTGSVLLKERARKHRINKHKSPIFVGSPPWNRARRRRRCSIHSSSCSSAALCFFTCSYHSMGLGCMTSNQCGDYCDNNTMKN